jgi:hypothetical protein
VFKRVIALVALLLTMNTASAKVTVLFLNGIAGDSYATKLLDSAAKIKQILQANGLYAKFQATNTQFEYFRNPGDGFIDDALELREQAQISGVARLRAEAFYGAVGFYSPEYKAELGKFYLDAILNGEAENVDAAHVISVVRNLGIKILSDVVGKNEKLIVVSHSQGNFFAEAVDAFVRKALVDRGDESKLVLLDRNLRFVGVASVAASTPNQRYVSLGEDKALDAHALGTALMENFSMLDRNTDVCDALVVPSTIFYECMARLIKNDPSIHGFLETYTSELVDRHSGKTMSAILSNLISDSFDEIVDLCSEAGSAGSCNSIKITKASCDTEADGVLKWVIEGTAKGAGAIQPRHAYDDGTSFFSNLGIHEFLHEIETSGSTCMAGGWESVLMVSSSSEMGYHPDGFCSRWGGGEPLETKWIGHVETVQSKSATSAGAGKTVSVMLNIYGTLNYDSWFVRGNVFPRTVAVSKVTVDSCPGTYNFD